jgi:hypothetical protein
MWPSGTWFSRINLKELTKMKKLFSKLLQIYSNIFPKDATLRSLFISGKCSIYFRWYFHPSSGAHTTGICNTVTVICRYRGEVGTGLSVLC